MGSKSEAFFVNGSDGDRRKVKPGTRKFRGNHGEHRLQDNTYVNGTLFNAGLYPFVFWGVPLFDQHDNPITDDGSPSDTSTSSPIGDVVSSPSSDDPTSAFNGGWGGNEGTSFTSDPDPTPSYTPEPSPSYDHSSSSYDGGSSSGGYDGGSSGGYDGGSSGGFDGGGGGGSDGGGF